MLQKLQQAANARKSPPPEQPSLPEFASRPFAWFVDLNRARSTGMGTNPIAWEAMAAYFRLTHVAPLPWEVRILQTIDAAYLATRNKPPQE